MQKVYVRRRFSVNNFHILVNEPLSNIIDRQGDEGDGRVRWGDWVLLINPIRGIIS